MCKDLLHEVRICLIAYTKLGPDRTRTVIPSADGDRWRVAHHRKSLNRFYPRCISAMDEGQISLLELFEVINVTGNTPRSVSFVVQIKEDRDMVVC